MSKKYGAVVLSLKYFLRFSFKSLKFMWLTILMLLSLYSFCKCGIPLSMCDKEKVNKKEL
ncbi:hypothetical protein FSC85_18780 [Salmonella enterica]|nr:hypothetical protein [Salmonella enterica]